eukprot:Partr_v1_DN27527_c2_g1_i1_m30535 putative Bacterial low temperature requirement A protein (LtrA)
MDPAMSDQVSETSVDGEEEEKAPVSKAISGPEVEIDLGTATEPPNSTSEKSEISLAGKENEHFTHHEFGDAKIVYLEEEVQDNPLYRQHLFTLRSRPRQFFIGDILYRERGSRKVTWDELFMDLIYVSIMSKLAAQLKNGKISWLGINDYFLTLIPMWIAWQQAVFYMNRYGRNDLLCRLTLYTSMALAFGMGLNAENAWNGDAAKNTGSLFIGTFLVVRLMFGVISLWHMYCNPEFIRSMLYLNILPNIAAFGWLASIFVSDLSTRRALWWSSYVADLLVFLGSLTIMNMPWARQLFDHRVALNIEHWVERLGLFLIIVLGEIIVSILGSSESPTFSFLYADSVFGLCIAISFEWLYFYLIDGYGGQFTHPVRYKGINGFLWTTLHLPLAASLTAAGAATGLLIKYDPAGQGWSSSDNVEDTATNITKKYGWDNLRWLVCGAYASACITMTFMSMLYHSKDGHLIRSHSGDATASQDLSGSSTLDLNRVTSSETSSSQEPKKRMFPKMKHRLIGRMANTQQPTPQRPLPACVRRWQENNSVPVHELIPRYPKWLRLLCRFTLGLLFLVVGAAGKGLSVIELLALLACIAFSAVLLEEYGKVRIAKNNRWHMLQQLPLFGEMIRRQNDRDIEACSQSVEMLNRDKQ